MMVKVVQINEEDQSHHHLDTIPLAQMRSSIVDLLMNEPSAEKVVTHHEPERSGLPRYRRVYTLIWVGETAGGPDVPASTAPSTQERRSTAPMERSPSAPLARLRPAPGVETIDRLRDLEGHMAICHDPDCGCWG